MNPFIQSQTLTQAGVFIAIGSQSSTVNIAEKICAAMANKIPENKKILDQNWWTQCVSNIPHQVDAMVGENNYSIQVSKSDVSKELAQLCFAGTTTNATQKSSAADIMAYTDSLQGLTSFNCLAISALDKSKLTISLSFFTITHVDATNSKTESYEITVNTSITNVDMTNKKNAQDITQIFDGFSAISGEDYYVSIQQKQPILQSN